MKYKRYTKEELINAVANSESIRESLTVLGIVPAGGNYLTIKKQIKELSLDTSHFKGMAIHKGKFFGPKRLIEDYLSNKYSCGSNRLRLRIIREGLLIAQCSNCKLEHWLDNPIPLELDHIDGNHVNNNLSNLRLLCPNCHALTPNYRGKNISS